MTAEEAVKEMRAAHWWTAYGAGEFASKWADAIEAELKRKDEEIARLRGFDWMCPRCGSRLPSTEERCFCDAGSGE